MKSNPHVYRLMSLVITITIIFGVLFLSFTLLFVSTSSIEKATVTSLLVRQDGAEYVKVNSVKSGPCKIEVRIHSDGANATSIDERKPCSFKIGQSITVAYAKESKQILPSPLSTIIVQSLFIAFAVFMNLLLKRKQSLDTKNYATQ